MSAVGDVVHAMPCATALRRALPDAHIAWVIEPGAAPLLARHPDLDAVITIPRRRWRRMGWWKSRKERATWVKHLRAEKFDTVIDLQGLWKSAHIARLTGAERRLCFGDEQARELSWLGVPKANRITPPPEATHVVQRYLALLRPLGVTDLTPTWRFAPVDEVEKIWLQSWWPKAEGFGDRPWVFLNPGAGWETKRWPIPQWAALGARIESELAARAMFLWGPDEAAMREELLKSPQGGRFAHAPPNSLLQLRAMLTGCAVFVGGDTGPTHLAAALGVPCVSPHGGSDPIRNGPFGDEHLSLAVSKDVVPCVPCWRTTCNFTEHLACLTKLSVDTVFDAVAAQLKRHTAHAKPPAALLGNLLEDEKRDEAPGARIFPVPRATRIEKD
jgi:heptosyltransferase-1